MTSGGGILVSSYQDDQYQKKYGVHLAVGDQVTVLGLSDGGGVNAYKTRVRGIFDPLYYKNVFNYINFIDVGTYSGVYNFTGVAAGSLPACPGKGPGGHRQSARTTSSLWPRTPSDTIDTSTLKSESAVGIHDDRRSLKDHAAAAP